MSCDPSQLPPRGAVLHRPAQRDGDRIWEGPVTASGDDKPELLFRIDGSGRVRAPQELRPEDAPVDTTEYAVLVKLSDPDGLLTGPPSVTFRTGPEDSQQILSQDPRCPHHAQTQAAAHEFSRAASTSPPISRQPTTARSSPSSTKSPVRWPAASTSEERYDINASIHGGGVAGQAGALRHGIARALEKLAGSQRTVLKRAGFLTRDPRRKERKKYGQKGARARFQFSKR